MSGMNRQVSPSPARRILSALQIAALYVLPMALFAFSAVPTRYRYWIFGIGMALPMLEMIVMRWSLRGIGFRADTLLPYALPYVVFTSISAAGLVLLASLLRKGLTPHSLGWWDPSTAAVIILLSFSQELCFRGYLTSKLKVVFERDRTRIVANAALFAWMHVIFPDPLFSMAMTFVAGVGFAALYNRYPNMWLIGASHALLNWVATSYCFLDLTGPCAG